MINLLNGNGCTKVTLCDVYHMLEMTTTLISISCLDAAGYCAHFRHGMCHIKVPDKKIIAEVPLQHGLYALGVCSSNSDVALLATQKLTLAQAHKVLGHISCQVILGWVILLV
jgi:hypothetical protein